MIAALVHRLICCRDSLLLSVVILVWPLGQAKAQNACLSAHTASVAPSDAGASTYTGITAAMNGDGSKIVVGSVVHGHGGVPSGAAWVISNPGTALQTEVELIPAVPEANMFFSESLAMNAAGDVLIAAAPESNPTAGLPDVFVFRFDGTSWTEEWRKTSTQDDIFGSSVAVSASGDVFAAGRPMYTPPGMTYDTGAVDATGA